MKPFLSKLLGRASDLADVQPLLALFLGAALLAVFLAVRPARPTRPDAAPPSLLWTLYGESVRWLWAGLLVLFLVNAFAMLRTYLRQTVGHFQRTHGRVTEANYNAVQTIWGAEQQQGELRPELYWEEEVTERIESEDLTKPAVLRRKIVRHAVTDNPFLSARHEVTLRQNARKKGSALYGGYETNCRFTWKLNNPVQRELKGKFKFPLPAAGAMYDDLSATLNGRDVLPQMQLHEAVLVLGRDLAPGEPIELAIAFKSRGMSFWYFQVREAREIRDFLLTLNLPDLPNEKLNYPEGCMTPTEVKASADAQGSVLTYRLDHAISSKGMGVALPTLPQPGATTNAVLGETERGWMLILAALILGLTLAANPHAVLLGVLFSAAVAFGYGLLGDFSDLLLGFWGTAALVLLPMLFLLAWFLTRLVPGREGCWLALQLLIYGILYPTLAGLDAGRQTLYLNLCALLFLGGAAWQLARKLAPTEAAPPALQGG